MAAVAVVYFGAAKFGLSLAFTTRQVTAVWPPTGIALACVLVLGSRIWPGIYVGALLINLVSHEPVGTAAAIAVGNTLEALLGALLLRRVGFDRALERVSDVVGLVLLSAVASTTVSATVGVTSLALGGITAWSEYTSVWWLWWVGDAVGTLVVAPFLLAWAARPRIPWRGLRLAEAGALYLGLLVVSNLALASGVLEVNYLVLPFLIWAAMRFGQPEAASAVLMVASFAIWGAHDARGPFSTGTLDQRLILLDAYTAVAAGTALLVAALTAEHRRAEAALRRSHDALDTRVRDRTAELERANQELTRQTALFELLARHATDLIVSLDSRAKFVYVSPSVRGMLGYTPEELIGTSALDLVHPEDREEHAQALAGFRDSPGWTSLARCRRKDGSYAWTESNAAVWRDPPSGSPAEVVLVVRDLTTRIEAQRRFRGLLESAPDAMVIVDDSGEIGVVNAQTERLFGYAREELIGQPVE
ncbi:MAG TPA: MASE1 domain-containing protein, partial [Chloroflexota bacterium]|nr:MASE1 domain-containing protein [Chloroflexota bacterium]